MEVVNKKNGVIYCFPGYIEVGNSHNFLKDTLCPGAHRAVIQTQF